MKVKAGEELSEANAHIVCHQEPITHLSAILSTLAPWLRVNRFLLNPQGQPPQPH